MVILRNRPYINTNKPQEANTAASASNSRLLKEAIDGKRELERFKQWQKEMWIRLRENLKAKEIASRPDYIQMYEDAKQLHMTGYFVDLDASCKIEQGAKESLWRDQLTQRRFRDCIRYLFKQENVGEDELIESLVCVEEDLDRQNLFFQEVKDLAFATAEKSTINQLHDGELSFDRTQESENEKKIINELMNIRGRENYLQKLMK